MFIIKTMDVIYSYYTILCSNNNKGNTATQNSKCYNIDLRKEYTEEYIDKIIYIKHKNW